MKKKQAVILTSLLCLVAAFLYAAPQYEVDFVKGDITKKIKAVNQGARSHDSELLIKALNFAFEATADIGDDKDISSLVKTVVVNLDSRFMNQEQRATVSSLLANVFKTYPENDIRLAVLDRFSAFPVANNVSLVNAFVSEKAQQAAPMDDVLLESIRLLKQIGNKTSFNVLFTADLMGVWKDYSFVIEEALAPLINSNEAETLNLFNNARTGDRLKILRILQENTIITKKIKGRVAETALSVAISKAGESQEKLVHEDVELQLLALQLIADTKWTRSAKNATAYFDIARDEYEDGMLADEQFAAVVTNVASVACSDTGRVLSSYLDFLNKSMETNGAPAEAVVLSVIKALGGLGDKTAFDYLLYVTYLDYPEYITNAARNALTQLKW